MRVKLTDTGREKLERIDEATEQLEGELSGLFDNKEARRLRKALRRISRHLGEDIAPDGDGLGEDDAELDESDDPPGLRRTDLPRLYSECRLKPKPVRALFTT